MDCVLPTEIWSQIFFHACTDSGITGRSISLTSKYFNQVGKQFRLRSLAVVGESQIVAFLAFIETLCPHCFVENLYLYVRDDDTYRDQQPFDFLVELYNPNLDTRSFKPSPEEIVEFRDELLTHVILRILQAVALNLKRLHITFPNRDFIFPSVDLPVLSELTLQGSYNDVYLPYHATIPSLRDLRRLWLADIYASPNNPTITAIKDYAPFLTHLRLDQHNSLSDSTKTMLQDLILPPELTPDNNPSSQKRFPYTLEKLVFHPGMNDPPGGCGTSYHFQTMAMLALRRLATANDRFTLFPRAPFGSLSKERKSREGPSIWQDRNEGGEGCWKEP